MTTQVQPQEGPQSQPREAETLILVTGHPSAVMFGYIKCTVDSFKMLSNGSLRVEYFCCPTNKPITYYHMIIPASDIFDWLYCKSLKFNAIYFRLKKDSVELVKKMLSLNEGFNCDLNTGCRYVIFVLNGPIDERKYREFATILDAEDVRLGTIDDYEGRYRLECAQQKRNFESDMLSAAKKHRNTLSQTEANAGNAFSNDQQIVGDLSKFTTAPKVVMFGTYMCVVPIFEFNLLQSFKFLKVPQNFEFQKTSMDITIPFNDIELLQLCRDQEMPSLFLRLKGGPAKAIQLSLNLVQDSNDGYLYDVNSRAQTEQLVKVVFNDYYAFDLIADSLKLVSHMHKSLRMQEMLISEALRLLHTIDTIELRRELKKELRINARLRAQSTTTSNNSNLNSN